MSGSVTQCMDCGNYCYTGTEDKDGICPKCLYVLTIERKREKAE